MMPNEGREEVLIHATGTRPQIDSPVPDPSELAFAQRSGLQMSNLLTQPIGLNHCAGQFMQTEEK